MDDSDLMLSSARSVSLVSVYRGTTFCGLDRLKAKLGHQRGHREDKSLRIIPGRDMIIEMGLLEGINVILTGH